MLHHWIHYLPHEILFDSRKENLIKYEVEREVLVKNLIIEEREIFIPKKTYHYKKVEVPTREKLTRLIEVPQVEVSEVFNFKPVEKIEERLIINKNI